MPLLPTVQRTQLLEEISDRSLRVVKLIAPAGYGKTTLVTSFCSESPASARVDLEHVTTPVDLCRRIAAAVAPFQDELVREDLADRLLGLGNEQAGWETLAATFLAQLPPAFVLTFDNAESVHGDLTLQSVVERAVAGLPADARVIVCSRQNVFRFGRFAGPDRTRMLSARDLRLSSEEIRELFGSLNLSRSDLTAVERFTQGWPIVVMMLFALARRGRLSAYLSERDDTSDLYGYLASEVFATLAPLSKQLLEALAAISDARLDDLALLFPGDDVAQTVAALQSETPFITSADGAIELHPAMREMIAANIDVDAYRRRLFAGLVAAGRTTRAAEIAMLRGQPLEAARVLLDSRAPGGFWTPEEADILSSLPDAAFIEYPILWGAATHFRASHDVTATIQFGQRLLAQLRPDAPADVRIELMSSTIALLANRGHLDDALQLTEIFGTHPAFTGNATAATLLPYFKTIIAFYRGDPVDVAKFQNDFAPLFLSSPVQQSFRDTIVLAPYYRIHGEYTFERAAIERGVEIGRGTKFGVSLANVATYAAMSAWFWGDLALFERSITDLETNLAPSLANGFTHFIECARGRGLTAATGSEKMDVRTYAWTIAATLARTNDQRRTFGEYALIAAEHSAQRFCEVLARIVLAVAEPERAAKHLDRADRLASEMHSAALQSALTALRANDVRGTMLESLVGRLRSPASLPARSPDRFRLDARNGAFRNGDERVTLSPRERQLLVYLAEHPGTIDARVIAGALWPASEADRGLLSLRVTVNRLRKRVGDAAIIIASAKGYALDDAVHVAARSSTAL